MLAAVLAITTIPVAGAIHDPDFWWHLRAGQLILDRRALIATDPFTYTVSDHTWVMHEWGTEVLFALLNRAGGLGLIVAVVSVVTWVGVLCVYLRSRMRLPHHIPLGTGMVLAVITGTPIWGPRAQMITFALSCVFVYLGDRCLRNGGRAAYWLIPLTLLWCNLHSGFVIGLAFIAIMVGAEGAALLAAAHHRPLGFADGVPAAHVHRLLQVLGGCLAIAVINPYGPQIYLYPVETQASPAQQLLIQEWHSPDFHMWEPIPFAIMLLTLIAMLVANRRISARDAALVVVTSALALQSVRHIALFVAAVTPVWIEQADRFGHDRGWIRGTAADGFAPSQRAPRPLNILSAFVVTMIMLGSFAGRLLPSMVATRDPSSTYVNDFPVCATRWLAASAPNLNIFNQYGEGGYLANHLYSRGDRVFIFGDAALMGDPMLIRYSNVESLQPGWDATIRNSGTDVVVFDTNTPLAHALEASRRWKMVYADPRTEAFVATDHPVAGLAGPSAALGSGSGGDVCRQFDRRGLTPGS